MMFHINSWSCLASCFFHDKSELRTCWQSPDTLDYQHPHLQQNIEAHSSREPEQAHTVSTMFSSASEDDAGRNLYQPVVESPFGIASSARLVNAELQEIDSHRNEMRRKLRPV